jgi:phosphatidate cytidylyltransferase
MMSPGIALHDPVFRTYLLIVPISLVVGGAVLALLQYGLKKELGPIWATYRSWIVMATIGLLFVFAGRVAVIIGVTLLSIFGFREFSRVSGLYRDRLMTGAVYAAIITVGIASLVSDPRGEEPGPGWYGLFVGIPVFAITLILIVPVLCNRARGELQKMALSIVGFIYIGWMFEHLGFLANSIHAYGFVCYVIFATEINDIAAFVFGRLFGRHPLRSEISPRKTVEGAVGALIVSMILPWALRFSFPFFSATQLILTGLMVGIGGLLGDLSISVIKRDIGTKDMGATIPGHGGILDRIDSLIYVAPLFMHVAGYYQGLR